jgi:hypothetical protein
MKIVFALLGLAAISFESFAAEVPNVWDHPAAMSMGGAYTSVANDDSAFWTNPAGIVRTKKARSKERVPLYRAPNITFGANNKKVASNFSKLSSTSKRFEIKDLAPLSRIQLTCNTDKFITKHRKQCERTPLDRCCHP